jgi:hypothetical protein
MPNAAHICEYCQSYNHVSKYRALGLKLGENVEFHRDSDRENQGFSGCRVHSWCISRVNSALLSELAIENANFISFAKICLEKRRMERIE